LEISAQRVGELAAEGAQLAVLFQDVFTDEAMPFATPLPVSKAPPLELLKALSTQAEWARIDYEALAAKFGLFPEAAAEQINEYTEKTANAAFIELDETIRIDCAGAQRFLEERNL
jgi:hypothetical protein